MEGRKLQLTGGSTYVVSLPKRWVVASRLKAGDTVFVDTEEDGSIRIRPHAGDKTEARRMVFEEKGEERRDHLLRKLIGAYISGYGLIEIRFRPEAGPFVRRVARDFSRMVIGPEVIEETRNSVVLQDLSDPAELSAEKCLRRMYMTVRAMLEDAVTALRTGDESLSKDVSQRDQDVDRLYWMVAKQYHVAHAAPPGSPEGEPKAGLHNMRLIAKLLERIGDHAERIAQAFPTIAEKGLDERLGKRLEAAREGATSLLDGSFTALVTADIDRANASVDALGAHQRMIDELYHAVATRKGEELLALGSVVDSLGRAGSYAADIGEVAINHGVLLASKGRA